MTTFTIKTTILRQAFSNPEYSERLKQAKTLEEIQDILLEYSKKKGYRIKEV